MLKILSEWTVEQLVEKKIIDEGRRPVYIYGCELLFSTTLGVVSVLLISLLTRCFLQAVVFLFSFMPIRTVANGYHASSYRNCFLLTNLIAFSCIAGAGIGSEYIPIWAVWCIFLAAQCLIWFRGPFRSRKHPLRDELVERNRQYMHRIQCIEGVTAVIFTATNIRKILDTIILATAIVAFMIYIAEKEGQKNVGDACSCN